MPVQAELPVEEILADFKKEARRNNNNNNRDRIKEARNKLNRKEEENMYKAI